MVSYNDQEITANISTQKAEIYIDSLQHQKNKVNIPTYVFLSILFILGSIGNLLIILIYSRRKNIKATGLCILSIAVVDLMTSLLTIPVIVYVNTIRISVELDVVCKIYFANFFNGCLSVFLLVAVAFVRYRKIQCPFGWQVRKKHIHIINLVIIIASFMMTAPHVAVHGTQKVKTDIPEIYSHQCRVDDGFKHTLWPKVIIGSECLTFLLCCLAIVFMYVRIGLTTRQHMNRQKNVSGTTSPRSERFGFVTYFSESSERPSQVKGESAQDSCVEEGCQQINFIEPSFIDESLLVCETSRTRNEEMQHSPGVESQESESKASADQSSMKMTEYPTFQADRWDRVKSKRSSNGRTTRMLFTVTIIYVVTNSSTIALIVVRALDDQFVQSLSPFWASLYALFFHLYLVNCAVNPFVYSFWTKRFRQECWTIFRRSRK